MSTFEVRAGDANVALEVQLSRRDGTLQPLSGTETGSFIFSDFYGSDVVTKTMVISDGPNSKVKCTLSAGDTNARKGQVLRVRIPVAFATGVETFPTEADDLIVVVT